MKMPNRMSAMALLVAFALAACGSGGGGGGGGSTPPAPTNLDLSFGTNGIVTTDFNGSGDTAYALAIDANGRIVVAGRAWNNTDYDFALARYLP